MGGTAGIDRDELRRYLARVSDRWPVERALLAGARLADARGAGPQRERGPEYLLVLVSRGFDGIPWLERVHQAERLWDASVMGAPAEVHCYTEAEFARRLETLPRVRRAAQDGIDLLAQDDAQAP